MCLSWNEMRNTSERQAAVIDPPLPTVCPRKRLLGLSRPRLSHGTPLARQCLRAVSSNLPNS